MNRLLNRNSDLFFLIAEGDEVAFEQVFRQYVKEVGQIIFRIVKSEAETQDLVQEVFMHLWLGRAKLATVNDPELWLYRIAYNQSYLHIRKKMIHKRATARLHLKKELEGNPLEAEWQTNLNETARLVQQAILQLPPQSLRIYQLSRQEGLKPQEIAGQLGISTQSVRNSLTRSARIIREYLVQRGIIIPLFLLFLPVSDFF